MKSTACLLLCLILGLGPVFAQELEPPYFPQEQIVLEGCDDNSPSECLFNSIEQTVFNFLSSEKNKKLLLKSKLDTIKIDGRLLLDSIGDIDISKSVLRLQKDEKLNKKLQEGLKESIASLSVLRVLNKKAQHWESKHLLNFTYVFSKENGQSELKHISPERKYSGGVIEEVAVFPGCERYIGAESVKCFQYHMENHIKKHFQYPKKALVNGISGEVKVLIVISKDGTISNIKTKGGHKLLKQEAIRIVELLPRFGPAKQNGKPVKIPFSIPINFVLRKSK
nr:energy transducer TonB [Allomuricauda sp.]